MSMIGERKEAWANFAGAAEDIIYTANDIFVFESDMNQLIEDMKGVLSQIDINYAVEDE